MDTKDIPYLRALRDELVQGIELERHGRRRRRTAARVALATAAVAAAAASGLAVFGGHGSTPSAEAAVLRHARSAVAPRGTVILYEKAVGILNGSRVDYESWQLSSPPYSYRVIKGPTEGAYDGSSMSEYDPATNAIVEQPASKQQQFDDPVADLRRLLASGDAHIVMQTTIDGRAVYEITSHSSDALLNGTVYVDASTYAPVRVQLVPDASCQDCVGPETIDFLDYRQLAPTADNLRLLSLAAQHPQAHVVTITGRTSTDTTATTTEPKSGGKPTTTSGGD
jgi:hypothetical protein